MLSVNFYFFIFLLFFQQASTQEFNITVLMANCLPVAVGLQNEAIAQYQLQKGCQSLELPYREMLDLRCCEVEYQEKENSSAPRYHGCMSFLSNFSLMIFISFRLISSLHNNAQRICVKHHPQH
jgi:hypothetical protein